MDDASDKKEKKKVLNREAVKRCRSNQQTYMRNLELKVTELNKEIQLKNEQLKEIKCYHMFIAYPINFNKQFNDWFTEPRQRIMQLRRRLIGEFIEADIFSIVDNTLSHFYTIFNIKKNASKNHVFTIIYGSWMTPAQRCTMWIGGIRPTDMLKLIKNHIELFGTIEMESLSTNISKQQNELTSKQDFVNKGDEAAMTNYLSSMSSLVEKLTIMHDFMSEADVLRHKTLSSIHKILKTRQRVLALFTIHDHIKRLTTLSDMFESTTTI
ncbi:TGACG-sequence-specific DNA-binding protein TGA-2.1-like [Rutidosis leptorrhynchoides]|uniref:TGACG-sequence-specific DNA-binding protein TGA-2.1-like n=1 Tax=Rutidosis leptorrhynchoides TaxID=125765 RepID=UPI003A997AF0